MQHPGKPNRQQAHAPARFPFILRALLLGFFLGIAGLPAPAETAVLKEFRMGDHDRYLRVVFEFSGPVQYQLFENAAEGIVSIRFLDTTSQLPETSLTDLPQCIDTVSTAQEQNHIVTNILLNPKGARLNPFSIQEPDRIVLDVFCGEDPEAAAVLHEPRDIVPSPVTATTAEPPPDKPQTVPVYVKQAQPPTVPSPPKDNSQKHLLLLLAAITGIIILIITLIIFQKRNISERHAEMNPAVTGDDDVMRAIDTKIKEKLMKYDE